MKQSTKDFLDRIAAATRAPLGWAILPGTSSRAAIRVTVLCADGEHWVWIRHHTGGADIELIPRATLTHFVAHELEDGRA